MKKCKSVWQIFLKFYVKTCIQKEVKMTFFNFLKNFDHTQRTSIKTLLGTKLHDSYFLFHCFIFRDSFTARTEVPLIPSTGFLCLQYLFIKSFELRCYGGKYLIELQYPLSSIICFAYQRDNRKKILRDQKVLEAYLNCKGKKIRTKMYLYNYLF